MFHDNKLDYGAFKCYLFSSTIGLVCHFYVKLLTHIEVFKLPVVVDAGCERLSQTDLLTTSY